MSFEKLDLIEPILRALKTEGYTTPTPIQEQAIPYILQHRDLLGCAQTGTGKTAAFAIPILQLLFLDKQKHKEQKSIKALILTPTRELAIQISESFTAYGKNTGLKNLVIFGGVSQNPQVDALRRGVDILIATPGRLLDLMNQRHVHIDQIKMLILDEADRMLDMGFVNDVKKIIAKVPANRQTLFFSATMPNEIQHLADSILQKPARVEVAPVSSTADTIQQSLYYVSKNDKRLLLNHILEDKGIKTALVFTRTKHGADKVVKDLLRAGITAEAIHGNKSQNARQRALANFKNRTTRVLIATDIAARGIDIDDLTHVINYEIPNIPETYVHRIGRTGRAGASGIALTFCDGEEEIDYLKDIHKLIAKEIPVELGHPYPLSYDAMTAKMMSKAKNGTPKSPASAGGRHGGGNKRAGAGGRPSGHRGSGGATNSRGGASGMSGASRSSSGRR
ncbi:MULTISPECIES: DEAD/DEAH box helicase [Mucilaginibacter]|uniref:DEAD/DEAH box helicase n=1 Tax=Mucilaginibacter TaxID=423349 RepID=UPI002090AC2D|nr:MULTISPECIES: DEAD/DEAH box helicase [Mucilaginibacter]MEB0249244.1 DEAD/DEAH box helicase [Mucilaginibacter sp. 5B2]MCO5934112.1 DEAD/DEAH box helicase [Mucilaginibacter aurantiaciroseus]MEB0261339.1 DEAD/DEAH box helicase [Mucilaginibacter sp. 10I4]MEB0278162.1 DEAD/DEAH box helicase [Mucilaginibacter sp. 10B2]MEB0301396.1 DEAD/DEAH box helicase [Mucilaginibacter sp. 5C4]